MDQAPVTSCSTLLLSALTNVDRVTDFSVLLDTIDLKHSIFGAAGGLGNLAAPEFFAGAAAHDANDRIIYNPANGFVTYDSIGTTLPARRHFATLAPHLRLTNADADLLVVA